MDVCIQPQSRVVTIGTQRFPYVIGWTGEPLTGKSIAIDTETELATDSGPPPRLALATAAGEKAAVVIHPDQLAGFILAHHDRHILTWNGGSFDFWVVERFLHEIGANEALATWWAIADDGRLHDGMLLDGLLRLADHDGHPHPRDLATVGREYTGLEISKDDPYRLRYAETIGADWQTVDPGFFEYAIKDAILTYAVYKTMYERGKQLWQRFDHGRDVYPDAVARFGLFTEAVQVKKAIALAQITRHGMQTDRAFISSVVAGLEEQMREAIADASAALPGVYITDKASKAKSGKPSMSTKVRDEYLEKLATSSIQLTPTGKVSARRELWEDFTDHDDFVHAWLTAEHAAKDLTFFSNFVGERVHPKYMTLKRSGRVSASSPNIMGLPRKGDVRGAFIASPGHLLLAADYSAIELRTFAAHAFHRYGWSDLRDTFFAGVDPHERTGAMMLGMELDDFRALKQFPDGSPERKQYDDARQAAKPINFGVPGGLGARRIVGLAKKDYHVMMTEEEATARRNLLMQSVIRELQPWLADDSTLILARSLRTTPEEIRRFFGDMHLSCIRKTLAGNPVRNDGQPYSPEHQSRIWAAVTAANRNPDIALALANRQTSEDLARTVCHAGVTTLTSRVRGRASYGQCRNTPFQGLAADGAGLAIYRLIREGYRVVGFLHDEVLIELPDEGGYVSLIKVRQVENTLIEEMKKVLCGDIPVAVESGLMYRWAKGAKMRTEGDKAYPLDAAPPPQSVQEDVQPNFVVEPENGVPVAWIETHGGKLACGDCLQVLASLPPDSVNLVFGSPPYEDARTYGIAYSLSGQAWVDWMVKVFQASLRVCAGLVAIVLEGRTQDFRWSAVPALLMADLHRAGIHLRKPPIFHRYGIPGSGGKDWLRNDYEFILCATRGGRLSWADPTACGQPPKYASSPESVGEFWLGEVTEAVI
jgi:hypothetical protein